MKKILLATTALIIVAVVGGAAILSAQLNNNETRQKIVSVLSHKTGRTVKLDGKLGLGLSWQGVRLSVAQASLGNPPWASRANAMEVGKFELGVALLPLLSHQLVITDIVITDADIQLETSPDHGSNLIINRAAEDTAAPDQSSAPASLPQIRVDHATITNSKITVLNKNGQKASLDIGTLTVTPLAQGLGLKLQGALGLTPFTVTAILGTDNPMIAGEWPITLDFIYDIYRLQATGKASLSNRYAVFTTLAAGAGNSVVNGTMAARWDTPRPQIKADLTSTHFDLADFTRPPAAPRPSLPIATSPAAHRVFNDNPLPLDQINSFDSDITFTFHDAVISTTKIDQAQGRFHTAGGHMEFPAMLTIGQSALSTHVLMDASIPIPQIGLVVTSQEVDLSDLLGLIGLPPFLSGESSVSVSLTTAGNTPHMLAGNVTGSVDLAGNIGSISTSVLSAAAAGLLDALTPGGSTAMNCFAARFVANKGIVRDHGILIDTSAATIAGKGGIDMNRELVDFSLRPQTKLVTMGGLLPPLYMRGPMANPAYSVDPKSVVKNVVSIFSGQDLDNPVPDIQSAPGQNACVYTLDHPVLSSDNTPTTSGEGLQNAAGKIQDISKRLLKGLFGAQ